ncbi:MAG: type I glyceraldehyde-3-phosphate dehydrogenase [archaeon]
MRVAINGFGRIGRAVFRRAIEKGVNVVAVNDLANAKTLAYLLKFDSVYGNYGKSVEAGDGFIKVDGKKIIICCEKEPENLPWKKLGVDIVVESTGFFTDGKSASKHLAAGAKKVLISASGKNVDYNVVLGVNEKGLKREHKIISMASCTTNCLAPIVKILDDEFGVKSGFLTTVHAYTGDQKIIDSPHGDFRRGRAAGVNLVPTTSGAAKATADVIPKLKGKIDGMAIRAPVACGSICDFVCEVGKSVSVEEVNRVMKKAAGKMKGILEYSEDDLVSTDVIGNSASSIFDSKLTKVNGNLVKVLSWYDNEWGYSCRVIDLLRKL